MPALKVIRVPTMPRMRRAGAFARRGLSAVARRAMQEKHTLTAVGAATALGLARRFGVNLPKIDVLGTAGTYGAAAWAFARYTRSNVLAHVATGLLSVAGYQFGSGGGMSGDDEGISGDLDD
jgi:hypothetical protein